MCYRRKNSPYWYVDVVDASGKRIRKSTQTSKRQEAEALEAKWRLDAFQQKQWGEQPKYTFDQLMVKYLETASNEKRRPERDLYSAKNLQPHFTGRELATLGPPDMRAYIDLRKAADAKPATINRELGLLSVAINFSIKWWGWKLENPVRGCRLKPPKSRVRFLSDDEAVRLLKAAREAKRSPHLLPFILIALHTGCRSGELLGLEWSRVDLQNGLIHFDPEDTKDEEARSVPLNDVALEALKHLMAFRDQFCPKSPWVFCNRKGLRIASVKTGFRLALKKAGIQNFRIHDQRHTAASWAINSGASLSAVRDMLGHASVKMTEKYAHLEPYKVREVSSLLGKKHGTLLAHPANDAGAASEDAA